MTERPDRPPIQAPLGELERALIDEYLRARGYDPSRLDELPVPAREKLLRDASLYASAKLTEIESRSQFVDQIHDRTKSSSGE